MVNGLVLEPLQARTSMSLIVPDDDTQGIVVQAARKKRSTPVVLVGTGSLKHCSTMTYERKNRRLTLRCRTD